MATIVVDDRDILRIKSTLLNSQNRQNSTKNDVPKILRKKQLSDARKAGWNDTLVAKRKERLLWKTRKEEEDEERRRDQDREEANLKAQQRKETIDRASKLIYEREDRVKALRSQQLYVDVIADRERQIVEKEAAEKVALDEENRWHESTMAEIKQAEQEEARRAAVRREKTVRIGNDLRKQRALAQEKEVTRLQRKQEEEQALIQRIQLEDREAEEKAAKEHRVMRLKAKAEIAQIALDAKENRARRLAEEEEDARVRAKQRENMINLANKRSELEKKHFEERQRVKRMLSDTASRVLEERAARELETFLKGQREHQAKEEKRQEEEAQAHAERLRCIEDSRKEQILRIREEKQEEARINATLAAYSRKMAEQSLEAERAKEMERRRRNIEIRRIQERQVEEDRLKRDRANKERLAAERMEIAQLSEEDEMFRQFAAKEIERFKNAGKNAALLERSIY